MFTTGVTHSRLSHYPGHFTILHNKRCCLEIRERYLHHSALFRKKNTGIHVTSSTQESKDRRRKNKRTLTNRISHIKTSLRSLIGQDFRTAPYIKMYTFSDSNPIHARSLCNRVSIYDIDACIINVWGCAEIFPASLHSRQFCGNKTTSYAG